MRATFAFTGCVYGNSLSSKKGHIEIRVGKLTWEYKTAHSTKNPALIFRKSICCREKLFLIFSFTWLFIVCGALPICSVLGKALLCSSTGLWHCPLEFNTIFLIFTDNLTPFTASGFCGCVYKLSLVTESFAVGQQTAHAETISARQYTI